MSYPISLSLTKEVAQRYFRPVNVAVSGCTFLQWPSYETMHLKLRIPLTVVMYVPPSALIPILIPFVVAFDY